jgi:hypothetical protein
MDSILWNLKIELLNGDLRLEEGLIFVSYELFSHKSGDDSKNCLYR